MLRSLTRSGRSMEQLSAKSTKRSRSSFEMSVDLERAYSQKQLAFVINPRKIFDIAAPANQQGSAITARIRQNIDVYDDVTQSGLLGSYVLDESWWQPGLLPSNRTS